jgi:hypothetical protein
MLRICTAAALPGYADEMLPNDRVGGWSLAVVDGSAQRRHFLALSLPIGRAIIQRVGDARGLPPFTVHFAFELLIRVANEKFWPSVVGSPPDSRVLCVSFMLARHGSRRRASWAAASAGSITSCLRLPRGLPRSIKP